MSDKEQIYVTTVICPQLDGALFELQELHSLEQYQMGQTLLLKLYQMFEHSNHTFKIQQ